MTRLGVAPTGPVTADQVAGARLAHIHGIGWWPVLLVSDHVVTVSMDGVRVEYPLRCVDEVAA